MACLAASLAGRLEMAGMKRGPTRFVLLVTYNQDVCVCVYYVCLCCSPLSTPANRGKLLTRLSLGTVVILQYYGVLMPPVE